jgi:hypothetical protein
MPGSVPRYHCPKDEHWDNKKKVCVKTPPKAPKKIKVPGRTIKLKKQQKKRIARYTIKVKVQSPKKKLSLSPTPKSSIKIPYLSDIKDQLGEHEVDYLENLLGNILNHLNADKATTKTGWFYYKTLNDILKPIQDDMKNIHDKYHTTSVYFGEYKRIDQYHFGDDDVRKVVLKQLHDYVKYFKKVADKEGRVDVDEIDILLN